MSVVIGDGVLGLEATHTWSPPQGIISGGIPDFTINDQAAYNALATSGYAVALTNISGLHSLPELVDEREAALGRVGEVPYDAEDGGKTVVYTGRIYGATMQMLRRAGNDMRRTFQAKSREAGAVHRLAYVGEGMMTVAPHAAYGSVDHVFFGRCTGLELGDEQDMGPNAEPTPYSRTFSLTIRMADPRVYETTIQSSTGNLDGDSIFATNLGSAPTEPTFKLQGVFTTAPVVIARGTEYVLAFEGLNGIADGLWVDFKSRRAWLNTAGTEMTPRLSVAQSNWWDPGVHGLDPGPNDIGVTGIGAGTWEIYWQHASD